MELVFKGGNEFVKLIIKRDVKRFKIANSKSNYQLREMPWKQLFDKGKETTQDRITEKMSDDEFIKNIVASMNKVGYIFASCIKDKV